MRGEHRREQQIFRINVKLIKGSGTEIRVDNFLYDPQS
jgi:hypothetical protein